MGLLQRTFLSKSLGDIGKLHWRVMMLGLPLVVLFVPLRRRLEQVRDETMARVAVRESIRQMAPADSLVSQAVELQPDRIRVRLTVTGAVPAARVQQAQSEIIRRTGKNVDISVRKVAGEDELALLRERLSTPVHGPLDDLDALRPELFPKLDQPLREIWPGGSAKLVDHRLAFGEAGVLAIIRYEAPEEIHGSGAETMQKFLQSRLGVSDLQLDLIWIRPEPAPRRQKLALRRR